MSWKQYDYTGQWSERYGVVYQPLLQVKLSNGNQSFWPLALIDSGAHATVANSEIASELGINLAPCPTRKVGGVGTALGRECDVGLDIPDFGISQKISVLFVDNLPFNMLLGQRDFFSVLDVRFEKAKNKFYLRRST